MRPAVEVPGFISEYLRLYAAALAPAVVAAVVVAVDLFIRRLPGQLRSMRAASWPLAQGTIEAVNVKTVSDQALGELAYSYVANAERYSGYLLLQFADEQDAWDTIDRLKGQMIFVRYNATNPGISAVRTTDQAVFFVPTPGNFIQRLSRRLVLRFEWRRWTKVWAGNWPVTRGRVEHAAVTPHDGDAIWLFLPDYIAEVSYSYHIDGEYYSGRIERSFFRERSATAFVNALKDKGVMVRYNQSSPSVSVLLRKDQETSETTHYQPAAGE